MCLTLSILASCQENVKKTINNVLHAKISQNFCMNQTNDIQIFLFHLGSLIYENVQRSLIHKNSLIYESPEKKSFLSYKKFGD